ncbi:MAG TPA: proton-conducting transporter membrane subunit [Patescibacteria group bacterium]
MDVNGIIYGVFVYFLALALAAALSLSGKYLKKAAALFVGANVIGFITGAIYLARFSSEQIVLARWEWLFHFSPTLSFLPAIFFTLISGVAALVGVYGVRYLELYEKTYDQSSTQFLTILFVLGMQGVLFANNPFAFLFFWEVMSITSFFLVMADRTQESARAAFLYFIMTHLGASAILGGFLILGGGSLFFDFSQLQAASQAVSPALAVLSFLLFLFGFGSKAGLVPFHVWLPEAHPQAPSNVSALMSGLMLKIAVYGFLKVVFSFVGLPYWTGLVVIVLGLLSGIVGALYAVVERDMKKAFAYSSIENMGIIFTMLGVSLYVMQRSSSEEVVVAAAAITAFAIFHAISHAIFKTALFLSSGVVISRVHTKSLEFMGGLAKILPVFSFAFLLAILAAGPLPPFSTFYGEWGFIQNMIGLLHVTSLGTSVSIVLVTTLSFIGLIGGLAIFAMVKIFGISMLGLSRAEHMEKRAEKTDIFLVAPILTLSVAAIVLGIFAKSILASLLAQRASLIGQVSPVPFLSGLSSASVFFVLAFMLALVWMVKNYFAKEKLERSYQTWDCGQPIDSSMEYTATAFSAPVRFFFLRFLGRDKVLKSQPVVATNPWIRKYVFVFSIRSVWKDKLYEPIAKILNTLAQRLRAIQSGRIQYYLLLLLATLIITLIVVL